MKIEHWEARRLGDGSDSERILDWQNLLGVCLGKSRRATHCDESRGNRELTLHPADGTDVSNLFRYTTEGEILPVDGLEPDRSRSITKDLQTLNLNAQALQSNRAELLQVVRDRLRRGDFRRNLTRLRDRYLRPEPPERLEPYCQVAVQYIEKKLRRHGLQS